MSLPSPVSVAATATAAAAAAGAPTSPFQPIFPGPGARLGCGMHMTFYQSTDLTLWFSSWKTSGPASYAVALAGLFALAAAQEGLAAARATLARPPPCCRCGDKERGGGSEGHSNGSISNGDVLEAPLLQNGAGDGGAPAAPALVRPCCAARAAAVAAVASGANAASSASANASPSSPPLSPRKRQSHNPTCLLRASLSSLFSSRLGSSLLYAVHAAASYLLMLAAMTYNLGACAAVLAGLAAGHAATRRGAGAPLADACHAPRLEHARTLPSGALP